MNRTILVAALGTAQTPAWASSYYLPAILFGMGADSIAISTGLCLAAFLALFLLKARPEPATAP